MIFFTLKLRPFASSACFIFCCTKNSSNCSQDLDTKSTISDGIFWRGVPWSPRILRSHGFCSVEVSSCTATRKASCSSLGSMFQVNQRKSSNQSKSYWSNSQIFTNLQNLFKRGYSKISSTGKTTLLTGFCQATVLCHCRSPWGFGGFGGIKGGPGFSQYDWSSQILNSGNIAPKKAILENES